MIDEPTTNERLLSPLEVQALLGIKPGTLAAWRRRRKGPPFIRVGRLVRYSESALAKWRHENTVDPSGVSR